MAALISPSNNEWTQQETNYKKMDQKPGMKTPTTQEQQQLQKCPRCDSTNTKFCYFNNYSLTQPRYFCKACKRYWTKGGTLRNVPVGGGCRKNKRIKRPSSTTISPSSTLLPIHNKDPPQQAFSSKTTSTTIPMMLYGLPITNNYPSNIDHRLDNLQFHGYDHQQQLHMSGGGGIGLGFSSSGVVLNDDYRNGYAPNPLLSSYGSMFGSSQPSTTTSANPTLMASIISSSGTQKFMQQGGGEGVGNYQFKSLFPFENMQLIATNNGGSGGEIDSVKVEGAQPNMYNWNHGTGSVVVPSSSHDNQIQQIDSSSHHNNPSLHTWINNTTNWPDLTNIGSSVTSSLI